MDSYRILFLQTKKQKLIRLGNFHPAYFQAIKLVNSTQKDCMYVFKPQKDYPKYYFDSGQIEFAPIFSTSNQIDFC